MFHTPECFIQELPCSDPIGRPNDMVGRSSLGRHDVTRLSGLHVGVVEVGVNVSKWDIVRPRPLHTCNIHKVSGIIGVIICASVFWSIKLSAAATHSATRVCFQQAWLGVSTRGRLSGGGKICGLRRRAERPTAAITL